MIKLIKNLRNGKIMKILVCPKCKKELILTEKSYKCENNHSYDIAKQGYLNLLLGSAKGSGDDKEMCIARHYFHSCNFYKVLSDKLSEICLSYNLRKIVDAGCGEGYYIRSIREAFEKSNISNFTLCGIDLAKEAIILGAKSEKGLNNKIEYAVAGIFDMPIANESCDCVLSVFAPVPFEQAHRVLCKNGLMIVVTPGSKHLEGLKRILYKEIYDNKIDDKSYEGFETIDKIYVQNDITVTGDNIKNLFHMTPYFWKTSKNDSSKLEEIDTLQTKIEFVITIYKKI